MRKVTRNKDDCNHLPDAKAELKSIFQTVWWKGFWLHERVATPGGKVVDVLSLASLTGLLGLESGTGASGPKGQGRRGTYLKVIRTSSRVARSSSGPRSREKLVAQVLSEKAEKDSHSQTAAKSDPDSQPNGPHITFPITLVTAPIRISSR